MYGSSPKLGPKAVEPALESSFNMKIKNESNRLIGMVGMIKPHPIRCPLSVTLRDVSKNHEVVIFVII